MLFNSLKLMIANFQRTRLKRGDLKIERVMMMLNDLDLRILFVLYELKYNYDQPIKFKDLGFENNCQATPHLTKLRSLEYIDFDDDQIFSIVEGNQKVFQVYSGDIDLLDKGYQEVKELL